MAPDDGGMKNGGGKSGGGSKQALKKGPWTTTEDAVLREYVRKYGEGNWNAVQRNSGLMRCGKSCRLRWANHLRPNLKKGPFSSEEEKIIIELHAKHGNKWARMAAQLHGRTDNEIKNYWNTRVKRRQRAGLPIYPQELQSQNQQENHQPQSLVDSPYNTQRGTYYNNLPSLSHLDIFNPSTMKPPVTTHQFSLNSNNIFRHPPNSLSLSLPSSMRNSQFSSLSTLVPNNNNFGQGLSNSMPMPMPSFHNYRKFGLTTRPFLGNIPSNQNELISGMDIISINYSSGRLSSLPVTTASSSENTGSDFGSNDVNNYAGLSRGNSGLLEDLLEESQTMTRAIEESNYLDLMRKNDKGKSLWEDYGLVEEGNHQEDDDEAILTEDSVYSFAHGGDVTLNNNSEASSSNPNATQGEGSLQGINQVDEDIMSLLNNFPSPVPVQNWNNKNNSKIATTDDDGHKVEDSSKSQVVTTTTSGPKTHDWELGGYCWDNMPSFC